MNGIAAMTIHAPLANFVIVTTTSTIPVVTAPMPLITALRCQLPSRVRSHRLTMPACERVNAVNTPTT